MREEPREGERRRWDTVIEIVCDSQGGLSSSPRVRSPNGEGNDGEVVFLVLLYILGCGEAVVRVRVVVLSCSSS